MKTNPTLPKTCSGCGGSLEQFGIIRGWQNAAGWICETCLRLSLRTRQHLIEVPQPESSTLTPL